MQTAAQEWIDEGREEGREEGILETLLESISDGLGLRFGEEGIDLYNLLKETKSVAILRTVLTLLFKAESLDEIREVYEKHVSEQQDQDENGHNSDHSDDGATDSNVSKGITKDE